MDQSTRGRDASIVFAAGLVLTTIGCGRGEFLGFECRFALFAKEMLERGPSFFPTTYGSPYPDYPSLHAILMALASLPFGRVTVISAALPTAIATAATLAFTYLLGATTSRRSGFGAVVLALATLQFTQAGRSVSLDPLLGASAIWAFHASWTSRDRAFPRWTLGVLPGLILSFAIRGPIGLAVAGAGAISVPLARGEWRKSAGGALLSAAVLVAASFALFAAARLEGGDEFARRVIGMQAADRFAPQNSRSAFYYALAAWGAYAPAFPLAAFAVLPAFRSMRQDRSSPDRGLVPALAIWSLIVILGLSIPGQKKIRYLLPLVPAFALLAERAVREDAMRGLGAVVRRFLATAGTLAPFLAAAGGVAIPVLAHALERDLGVSAPVPVAVFLALGLGGVFAARRLPPERVPALRWGQLASTLVLVQALLVEPIQEALETTRPFLERVESVRGTRPLVFFRIGPDAEDIKYAANLPGPLAPIFLSEKEALSTAPADACFLGRLDRWQDMEGDFPRSFRRIAEGKIGHRACVAFEWASPASPTAPASPGRP